MTAVVMGPKSGSDRWYEFTIDQNPDILPSDEIVEPFMKHLDYNGDLPGAYSYELNSAIKSDERKVVMAIGNLHPSNERMPFASINSWHD